MEILTIISFVGVLLCIAGFGLDELSLLWVGFGVVIEACIAMGVISALGG